VKRKRFVAYRRRLSRRSNAWLVLSTLAALAALVVGYVSDQPAVVAPGPALQGVVVRRVIDGDTVKLEDDTVVRYIGVDTPEVRRRKAQRWIKEPEPFAEAATEANRRLVEGRVVSIEADVQPRDRYGRTLAYVYVDGEMVNERLIRDGLAKLMTIPPNVRHVDRLRAAQEEARQAKRGLWQEPGAFERN